MVLHTWTNISISNWQFLIPCYHQNSQEIMLNTFCSNRVLVAVLGCGGGVFWRGRRRRFSSVRLCCIMLFCKTIFLTGGGGFLTLLMAISLRRHIFISRQQAFLQNGVCSTTCRRSKFCLRCLCSLGGFFAIAF